MNNSTILKTDEIDFLVSLPKKTNEIINILKRNIVLSEKHCLNFSSNHNNLRHYVALAQNQTNKKADLPSFYQLRPTPHKFTFITFEFYHNPIFL